MPRQGSRNFSAVHPLPLGMKLWGTDVYKRQVLIGWSPLHEYYASYRPMYAWLEGAEGAGFWPALAAFGRCLGIAGHPVDAPMWLSLIHI